VRDGAAVLVMLGEISYSCYLIHHILIYAYQANAASFAHIPDAAAFSMFLIVLLLASYLLWALVEMPGRRLLVGRHGISARPACGGRGACSCDRAGRCSPASHSSACCP
jgi:peptidoglycan/LPS O-acetylase OafA/YrhL